MASLARTARLRVSCLTWEATLSSAIISTLMSFWTLRCVCSSLSHELSVAVLGGAQRPLRVPRRYECFAS